MLDHFWNFLKVDQISTFSHLLLCRIAFNNSMIQEAIETSLKIVFSYLNIPRTKMLTCWNYRTSRMKTTFSCFWCVFYYQKYGGSTPIVSSRGGPNETEFCDGGLSIKLGNLKCPNHKNVGNLKMLKHTSIILNQTCFWQKHSAFVEYVWISWVQHNRLLTGLSKEANFTMVEYW